MQAFVTCQMLQSTKTSIRFTEPLQCITPTSLHLRSLTSLQLSTKKSSASKLVALGNIRKEVNCRLKLLPKTGHFRPRFTSLSTKCSCISSNPMLLLCTITYPRHHFQRPKQIPAPITIYYAPAPFCSPSPSPIPSFPCMLLLITLNHCQQYDYFKTILFGAGVVVIESPSCRLHL